MTPAHQHRHRLAPLLPPALLLSKASFVVPPPAQHPAHDPGRIAYRHPNGRSDGPDAAPARVASASVPAWRDVRRLPPTSLRFEAGAVCVPVHYRAHWDDGFGARGWKLGDAGLDPEIIASTRETGGLIPTSVLVHDALDHLLSGFAPSGHRAEAMALAQLARRTGSDPTPDYCQMIREDLLHGQIGGESACSFIGSGLRHVRAAGSPCGDDRQVMADLRQRLGDEALTAALLARFERLGAAGQAHAAASWQRLGLDPTRSGPLGLAMQAVLEVIDREVEVAGVPALTGEFRFAMHRCHFRKRTSVRCEFVTRPAYPRTPGADPCPGRWRHAVHRGGRGAQSFYSIAFAAPSRQRCDGTLSTRTRFWQWRRGRAGGIACSARGPNDEYSSHRMSLEPSFMSNCRALSPLAAHHGSSALEILKLAGIRPRRG